MSDIRPARRRTPPTPDITPEVKASWRQRREDYSAGGVAYRRSEAGWEAALIATRGGTRWQLPKGTCEDGETALETAIREVQEEVGLLTADEGFLRAVEYWYWDTYQRSEPELVHKRVDFFLLRVIGGELSDDCFEVDATGWFALDHAADLLTFRGEQEVMLAAISALSSRPSLAPSSTPSPV
ncbi:MAG: NUDIX hydrolase [Caldilineaceae bacterium]